MSRSPHRFILSGGGTGGHIFPAIAIADAIRQREPGAEILFVGALGRMEMDKVPAAGYAIEGLWISGLQRSLSLKNLAFPLKVASSILKARKIIRQFRPDVVIGTGGYASGPTLRAASAMGLPCVIQEQNSFPGITNKLLSKKVNRICVAYDGMERWFPKQKIILTGNPVRKDILGLAGKKDEALQHFQTPGEKLTVLVMGGSLGALTINESIRMCLDRLMAENIRVIWQTGKGYLTVAESLTRERFDADVRVFPFISRMDLAYSAADIIVSRAGAIAISELCVVGKPCILIPSPNVAEDHQTKNANALVARQAAIMIPDALARNELGNTLLTLSREPDRMKSLSAAIGSLARTDATERITDTIFELIKE